MSVCLCHCFFTFPLNVTLAPLLLLWVYKNWEGWNSWHNSGAEGEREQAPGTDTIPGGCTQAFRGMSVSRSQYSQQSGWQQEPSHCLLTLPHQSKSCCLVQDAVAIQRRMQRRGTSKCGSLLRDYSTVRCCYFYCLFLLRLQSQVCLLEWHESTSAFSSSWFYKVSAMMKGQHLIKVPVFSKLSSMI